MYSQVTQIRQSTLAHPAVAARHFRRSPRKIALPRAKVAKY
jgi:hypothetical protein